LIYYYYYYYYNFSVTQASTALSHDWIIHLDEETHFNAHTVRAIVSHCLTNDEAVRKGEQEYGMIGQGVIVYGRGEVVNWVTTLADSVRVADDFGKFRYVFVSKRD
jgi:hypothetical protein